MDVDETTAATPGKYWAFISYSSQDKTWGKWLARSLETYRIPKALICQETKDGTVPSRLASGSRERDECGAGSDVAEAIRDALAQSRSLIVVCSPNAVA